MIAIIMSVYNGEKYIKEQIGSIIAGDCKDWKLFIFDDGSKDNTENIVKEFVRSYPDKIYFEKNRENLGAAGNFFNGTKRVKAELAPEAEYFCFSDQDDVWVEDKLSRSLAKIRQIEDGKRGYGDKCCTDIGSDAQSMQQLLHGSAFFGAHQEDTDERKEDAHGGNEHRCNDGTQLKVGR